MSNGIQKIVQRIGGKQNKVLLQRRTVTLKEAREKVEWLKKNSSVKKERPKS